ncbi:complex I intermediate-associated protein [Nemania sp. FL0916]|nr:complex I intermediate-associated protein [Nemania sp. FL0916]
MRSQVTRYVLRRPPAAGAARAGRGLTTVRFASTSTSITFTSTPSSKPTPTSKSTTHPRSLAPRPVLVLRTHAVGCRAARTVQRRTFFKLFKGPPRTLKEVQAEPGYATLLSYGALEKRRLRPPPVSDLVKAWREFFGYKAKHNRVLNSSQSVCAHQVLDYFTRPLIAAQGNISLDDIHLALRCLEKPPRDDPRHHVLFARALFREVRRRELKVGTGNLHNFTEDYRLAGFWGRSKYLNSFLIALSQNGAAAEAKYIFLQNLPDPKQPTSTDFQPRHSLLSILNGLAKAGQEQELRDIVKAAVAAGIPYDVSIHGVMTSFFAQRDNIGETKFWWDKPIRKGLHPAPQAYYDVLQQAMRTGQKEWALKVYEELIAKLESGSWGDSKACWDVSYQFAFVLLDKGIDQIEHMISVALDRTKDKPKSQPNMGTINCLLKCAVDKDDPYMAERFISLSEKLGFEPDLSTYILQLEYRLRAEDYDGAFDAFRALRGLETSSSERELPILNALIRGMCASSQPEFQEILEVTSYLEQRHVTLEPETVVSICMTFLKNDETYEVIDTLSLHTAHYSLDERRLVRKAFVDYCLDKKNSTARTWDAYALLRQFFPEVEVEYRVAIMDAFYDRRRSDMACHVFGHMRSHNGEQYRPTLETYVRCLEGIGRCPDIQSLRTIHNMAKMDMTIQLNTQINNALMIGYIACDAPYRALDFWKEITSSPEGPTYASLEIVFRAYEVQSDGDEAARELWAKMKKMDLDIPEHVYAAYLTTLAAHGNLEEIKPLLDDSDGIIGRRPDFLTFAYAYNALPNTEMQEEFESWAQHEYPPLWESLTKKHGRRRDEDGLSQFKISRPWKA